MSRTHAKYFISAKRLVVFGEGWTLTMRVANRGCLSSNLNHHGYKLRDRRWEKVGDILYADVIRTARGK